MSSGKELSDDDRDQIRCFRRSDAVGPVGLEPTTRGLKGLRQSPAQAPPCGGSTTPAPIGAREPRVLTRLRVMNRVTDRARPRRAEAGSGAEDVRRRSGAGRVSEGDSTPSGTTPTPDEAAALIMAAGDDEDWSAFVWAAMTTGARRGERPPGRAGRTWWDGQACARRRHPRRWVHRSPRPYLGPRRDPLARPAMGNLCRLPNGSRPYWTSSRSP
jgi:hypothetical protein